VNFMQLNIYVPKTKERLLAALAEEAARTGRSKNDLILEALEEHIGPVEDEPAYRTYPLGAAVIDRGDLYQDRLR
jgi:predicted DNA-binding protein